MVLEDNQTSSHKAVLAAVYLCELLHHQTEHKWDKPLTHNICPRS